jgi:hypothetical protein
MKISKDRGIEFTIQDPKTLKSYILTCIDDKKVIRFLGAPIQSENSYSKVGQEFE